jgi:hypothetical protein
MIEIDEPLFLHLKAIQESQKMLNEKRVTMTELCRKALKNYYKYEQFHFSCQQNGVLELAASLPKPRHYKKEMIVA